MSQQEFEPRQNESPSHTIQNSTQESEARPYYWSTSKNTGNIPKTEHPANFEDSVAGLPPIPPYSYQAQDGPKYNTSEPQQTTPPVQQQQSKQHRKFGFSPDGDALEHGYQPYNAYNMQAPPWARPQRNNKSGRIIALVVLGFLLINPLLHLLGGLLVAVSVLAISLLVIVTVGVVALVALVLFFSLVFGRPFSLKRFRGRRRWGN